MLDLGAAAILKQAAEQHSPPFASMTPAEARATWAAMCVSLSHDPPTVGKVQDHTVEVADGTIVVREYRPLESGDEALPALLFFHGGAWIFGSVDDYDSICRSLCQEARCVVLAPNYRLAPEHPFPTPLDDCSAAFSWAVRCAAELGIDARRVAVGGDSAGGNLATGVALQCRGEPLAPAFQLLIYPAVDFRGDTESFRLFSEDNGYLIGQGTLQWVIRNYLQDAKWIDDWRASPLLAPALEGLPPAFILSAAFDVLRDEGLKYADALSVAGVPTQYVCFGRQIHGFLNMAKVIPEALTAIDLCAAALRRAFATAPAASS